MADKPITDASFLSQGSMPVDGIKDDDFTPSDIYKPATPMAEKEADPVKEDTVIDRDHLDLVEDNSEEIGIEDDVELTDQEADEINQQVAEAEENDVKLTIQQQIENNPIVQKYRGQAPNVEMTRNTFYKESEIKGRLPGVITDLVDVPATKSADVISSIEQVGDEDITTETSAEWFDTFRRGLFTQPFNNQYLDSLEDSGRKWTQSVPSEAGENRIHGVRSSAASGELVGSAALNHFQASLRVGKILRVPLWHSGFWITIKTPSVQRQAEMYDQLRSSRIKAGMETYGRVFNNYTVFANAIAMDLAYECIYTSSLDVDPAEIRRFVDISDINTVVWALAAVIWPNGFEYSRARMGDPNLPGNTIKQVIRTENCQWTDITKLTEWQRNHMSKKTPRSMSVESIEKYRSEFVNRFDRRVVIRDKSDDQKEISILLSSPYADDYLVTGQRWINDLVQVYMSVAGRPGGDKARDDWVFRAMQVSEIRAFSHWIKEISDGEAVVKEEQSLLSIMESLSEDADIVNRIFEAIFKYINDIAVSIIAIPTDDKTEAKLPRFPYLIPIDPIHTFFTRLEQKFSPLYSQ